MSTAISTFNISQQIATNPTSQSSSNVSLKQYFKERNSEIKELAEALKSGNLAAAEQAYNNVVALGNNVLHKDNPFLRSDRGLDFNAIGGALQNGDLDGARQAFLALKDTFLKQKPDPGSSSTVSPDTVVNLSSGS